MARVLVTGAGGFVGRRLQAALRGGEHEVVALTRADGDIRNPKTFSKLKTCAHVFHLAASSSVAESWKDPAACYETNVIGTARVIDYCRRTGATLTFVSTYLYGAPDRLPIDEEAEVRPRNPFEVSKLLAEGLCRFHSQTTGQPAYIIRPFDLYGPGQHPESLTSRLIAQARAGERIIVEDLAPRRDYLYIDDFISGLMATMMPSEGCRVFNFGAGHSYSVREVVATIQQAAGTDLPVACENGNGPHEIEEVRADYRRARQELYWNPSTPFARGIKQTLENGT